MDTKKGTKNPIEKAFLVRLLDSETIDLLRRVEQDKPTMSRNAIVNECLKNWLKIMIEKTEPTVSLQHIFDKEMTDYKQAIKKDLDGIKTLLLIVSASQNIGEKGIGYIINQIEHILNQQQIIATLPQTEIEIGIYDQLPSRLQKEKDNAVTSIIED
jgi:hypothetical protein